MLNDTIRRGDFLTLLGTSSTAYDQQAFARETAFAYGTEISARHGQYLPLDLVAMTLIKRLTGWLGSRQLAADFVRVHADLWFQAVVFAEWGDELRKDTEFLKQRLGDEAETLSEQELSQLFSNETYLAAFASRSSDDQKQRICALTGTLHELIVLLRAAGYPSPLLINMNEALTRLRERARERLRAKGRRPRRVLPVLRPVED